MSTETYQPFAEGYIEIHDSPTITELQSWKADAKICSKARVLLPPQSLFGSI